MLKKLLLPFISCLFISVWQQHFHYQIPADSNVGSSGCRLGISWPYDETRHFSQLAAFDITGGIILWGHI